MLGVDVLSGAVQNNQTAARALKSETSYFLVGDAELHTSVRQTLVTEIQRPPIAGMLPLTFEHSRPATSGEKLTPKWFGRVPYVLSILSKHRFITWTVNVTIG